MASLLILCSLPHTTKLSRRVSLALNQRSTSAITNINSAISAGTPDPYSLGSA